MWRPPFDITNEMVSYISDIAEKTGGMTARSNGKIRPHLRRNSRIRSVHSSLKIEANSLSLGQVRDVIDGRTVAGARSEIFEVKDAYAAYDRLDEADPYSIKDFLRLHGIMTAHTVDESGVFRKGEEGVFSGGKCIFMAPPARLVPQQMEDLFRWMKDENTSVHPLIMSAVFHYELVFIHPFSDGNGRMARLWHTLMLSRWKPFFAYVPLESRIEKFQDEYYRIISQCHARGNSNLFVEFMLEQIDGLLDEVSEQFLHEDTETGIYVKKLLSAMEFGVPYAAAELMRLLGLRSKEALRRNYLAPALKQNLIKMTIPDRPTSKNQRYVKI